MPSVRSLLVLLAALAALAGVPTAAEARAVGPRAPTTAVSESAAPVAIHRSPARSARATVKLSATLQHLLTRVNRVRANHGRKPLRATICLTEKVAQPWAKHMASTGSMVHQDLSTVFETCPGLTRVGENIAYGQATPKAVMRAWMGSPGHRHNILDRRFRKIGLGVARDADGARYWIQDFGR